MGVVDETRQIVQDFLAPELRAVAVRLEALEKAVEANECRAEKRYQALEAQMDKRFQTAEAQMDKRFQITESHFEKRFQSLQGEMEKSESRSVARHGEVMSAISRIVDYHAVLERLGRLEEKLVQPAH
jgi:Skp family chaperone for outer membrane proteins